MVHGRLTWFNIPIIIALAIFLHPSLALGADLFVLDFVQNTKHFSIKS